jgi:hypothetical protein
MAVKVTVSSTRTAVVRPTLQQHVAVNQSNLVTASNRLSGLLDVDTSGAIDGSMLVYNISEEKFLASTSLEKQTINGGHF